MKVFVNVPQLVSWADICPGNNATGGMRKSSRIPKGNVYLKTALVDAANAARTQSIRTQMTPFPRRSYAAVCIPFPTVHWRDSGITDEL